MSWPAILLTATDRASLSLRRLNHEPCVANMWGTRCHDSRTFIGTAEIIGTPESWNIGASEPAHTDPRWPTRCACGYHFVEEDHWQQNSHLLYARSDTDETLTIREATAGMIWNATWLLGVFSTHPRGPDNKFLVMKLPDGVEWMIDGPSTNGPGWTRHGIPPGLTVTPSILSDGYHGFLTGGILTDDLEGRHYE